VRDLPSPQAFIAVLQGLGWLAIPVCLALMTVSAIVPIPAELPAMLNGAVLGLWSGSAVTWCGAMLGAWISFRGARWLHSRFGHRWVGTRGQARVATLGHGTGVVELILLRLTPVVAFHLINYVAGIARIPEGRFLWTTGLGILPGAFAFTAGGMAVAHWMSHPALKWGALLLVVGLVALRLRRN
jgi:uncharacterized membrane protein YdjX (TVP38/TMEM64 family)